MPRRNDIAKILVILAVTCIPAVAQQSFEQYIHRQKNSTVDAVERSFLDACGLPSRGVEHVFAVDSTTTEDPAKWERRKNLLHVSQEAETDFLKTVELRVVDGRPRELNYWDMELDTGQESNALFCLGEDGAVRSTRVVTKMIPVDGSGPGWTHVQVRRFDRNGKVETTDSYFADNQDHRVMEPRLSEEDTRLLGWNPDRKLVQYVLKQLGLMDKGK